LPDGKIDDETLRNEVESDIKALGVRVPSLLLMLDLSLILSNGHRTSPSNFALVASRMELFESTTSRSLSRSTNSVSPMTAELTNVKKLTSLSKR